MSTPLDSLQRRIDYHFRDPELLQLALIHRSCGDRNNERLEHLGDSVANLIVSEYLFLRFDRVAEGILSKMRATLVNRDSLAEIGRTLKLGECLTLGENESKSGGHDNTAIIADAVEALIGAIHLDSDFEACRRVVLTFYTERFAALDPGDVPLDSKTRLQEHYQQIGKMPAYSITDMRGPPHCRTFRVLCRIPGVPMAFHGEGKSRRRAEQHAAGQACEWLDAGNE